MWTDKCYRLILNAKFFEKMKIDRANKKSLQLNAFDNGTIRIFLIKTCNPNDCDELYSLLTTRFEMFKSQLSKTSSSSSAHHNNSNSSFGEEREGGGGAGAGEEQDTRRDKSSRSKYSLPKSSSQNISNRKLTKLKVVVCFCLLSFVVVVVVD